MFSNSFKTVRLLVFLIGILTLVSCTSISSIFATPTPTSTPTPTATPTLDPVTAKLYEQAKKLDTELMAYSIATSISQSTDYSIISIGTDTINSIRANAPEYPENLQYMYSYITAKSRLAATTGDWMTTTNLEPLIKEIEKIMQSLSVPTPTPES